MVRARRTMSREAFAHQRFILPQSTHGYASRALRLTSTQHRAQPATQCYPGERYSSCHDERSLMPSLNQFISSNIRSDSQGVRAAAAAAAASSSLGCIAYSISLARPIFLPSTLPRSNHH